MFECTKQQSMPASALSLSERGASISSRLSLCLLQVVVLEKGRFTPAAELSLKEREAGKDMYEMGTLLTTTDAGKNRPLPLGGPGVKAMVGSSLVLAVGIGAKLTTSFDWLTVMCCSRLLMRQSHSLNLEHYKTPESLV